MADIDKLIRLRDKYQEKADYYWDCYQMDGHARQLRANESNQMLSDALTDAINAIPTANELGVLKMLVMRLNPDDGRGDLALEVRRLQKRVAEGKVL